MWLMYLSFNPSDMVVLLDLSCYCYCHSGFFHVIIIIIFIIIISPNEYLYTMPTVCSFEYFFVYFSRTIILYFPVFLIYSTRQFALRERKVKLFLVTNNVAGEKCMVKRILESICVQKSFLIALSIYTDETTNKIFFFEKDDSPLCDVV